jgi:hypothetical protein
MKAEVKELIEEYLNLQGIVSARELEHLIDRVTLAMWENKHDEEAHIKLRYIFSKLSRAHREAVRQKKEQIEVTIKDTLQSIEQFYKEHRDNTRLNGPRTILPQQDGNAQKELGKIVDVGDVPFPDRADEHLARDQKFKLTFRPDNKEVYSGPKPPAGYEYQDERFLETYYSLRAIEFGNWVSQKDRMNYVAALGLGLYDLHKLLGFRPEQISINGRLVISFGARGRGAAMSRFEPGTYAINFTRYSRPGKKSDRSKLLLQEGGIGSLAFEYGQALDYFAGLLASGSDTKKPKALSGGKSARTAIHNKIMKQENLPGYMERILYKIIWKAAGKYSPYYDRLKKNKNLTAYYFRRETLFARAFEAYILYKLQKRSGKNIFLVQSKLESSEYLTQAEIKPLEKDFDTLIKAIQKKIK